MLKKIKLPFLFTLGIILTLGLSISLQSVLAVYTNPTAIPPNANPLEPINVGSALQTKNGPLTVTGNLTSNATTTSVLDTGVGRDLSVVGKSFLGGNVGIAIAPSATYKLNIAGNVNLTGALSISGNAGTSGQVLTSQGAGLAPTWAAAGGGGSWTTSGTNIFNANTGNVGIGTNAPSAKLDVSTANTDYAASAMRISNTSATGQSPLDFYINGALRGKYRVDYAGNVTMVANGGDFYFLNGGDYGTGVVNAIIKANGNVGIGTASPTVKLEVNGTIKAGGTVIYQCPLIDSSDCTDYHYCWSNCRGQLTTSIVSCVYHVYGGVGYTAPCFAIGHLVQ